MERWVDRVYCSTGLRLKTLGNASQKPHVHLCVVAMPSPRRHAACQECVLIYLNLLSIS